MQKMLDRIEYDGLSEGYITQRFSLLLSMNKEQNPPVVPNMEILSHQAYKLISKNQKGVSKLVTWMAFRFKDVIKKIPFLGKIALGMKVRMLNETLVGVTGTIQTVDMSAYFNLDINDFISVCYHQMLERAPDPDGYLLYQKTLCMGAPYEAVVYLIAISPEFAGRYLVAGLECYKKRYKRFLLKIRIKKIPVISWVVQAQNQQVILAQFLMMEADSRQRQREIAAQLDCLKQEQQAYALRLSQTSLLISQQSDKVSAAWKQSSEELSHMQKQHETQCLKIEEGFSRLSQKSEEGFDLLSKKTGNLENMIASTIYSQLQNSMATNQDKFEHLIACLSEKMDFALQKIDQLEQIDARIIEATVHPVISSIAGGVNVIQTKEFMIGMPSEEWRLSAFLARFGYFERGTELLFKSLMHSGARVIDVGANLGIYTLHAAKAGCTVYSYEPTPFIFHLLNENIQLNGFKELDIAHTFNLAVGQAEGEAEFTVFKNANGHNTLFATSGEGEKIKVRVVCLDHSIPPGEKIDVVKIDAEGSELFVLRGMRRIITDNPQIQIIMEFSSQHLKRAELDPQAFLNDIRVMGFDIQAINDFSGELNFKSDLDIVSASSINLFLTQPNASQVLS